MTRSHLITLLFAGSFFAFGASAYSQTSDTQSNHAFSTAQQLISDGELKAGIKSLEQIWETDDQNFELCQLLVDAYGERIDQVGMLKKKKIAKSMRTKMEQCYALKPDDETAQLDLIMFHMEAPSMVGGDKEIAKKIIDEVAVKNPVRGLMLKARLAMNDEDFVEASKFANEALKISPEDAEALNVAGLIAQRQKLYDNAVSLFQRCVAVDAEQFDCHYQIGKTTHLSGAHTREGIVAFEAFIRNGHDNPEYLAHAHYRLAELLIRAGKNADAVPHLESAIALADLKSAKKRLAKLKIN